MDNCLYMICPSDNLEPVILDRFKGHKYFYTSLGNHLSLDHGSLLEIASLIVKDHVDEITIVLSEDNRIVRDALSNQDYAGITGLDEVYKDLIMHQRDVSSAWLGYDHYTMILSYYINEKIENLRSDLSNYLEYLPQINGKLYSKDYESFRDVHSNLVCIESTILN